MLWEVEITPIGHDPELTRVQAEFTLLAGRPPAKEGFLRGTARGYLLEGTLDLDQVAMLMNELLLDPIVEAGVCFSLSDPTNREALARPVYWTAQTATHRETVSFPARPPHWTVLLKPGVMDPVAESVLAAARDLGVSLDEVRTFRRYILPTAGLSPADETILRRVLVNDAIEQIVTGELHLGHLTLGEPYTFRLITVPLRELDDAGLQRLSRDGQLALNLAEMRAIQQHFRTLGRDPTDVELETLAQAWSEHCSHKTLKGQIDFQVTEDWRLEKNASAIQKEANQKLKIENRKFTNLLKETIFAATQQIRQRLGPEDWCVRVFEDNAGVVRFDEKYNVCFKVETHNHPSALEPYGGANTGVGGVIRDPLGTGLGAKPICNTDVFCFAPPTYPPEQLPPGVLHPNKVMTGVVAGVRDYGNRMGIPTVNGAVCFDERYLGNPLVYCGTVGLIPRDCCHKQPQPGDLIVVVGGRTGRDGIHGATFSSIELTEHSEKVSGGAVQIGNAITEKKLLDVLLQARDRKLYHAITDCGAGGFSSAIGEMGAELGAVVDLEKAPLKYQGLSYTEIWISEAQERMVLAVPPENWPELEKLCASENVEATVLGRFEKTGRLRLRYQGQQVADLDLHFLHEGRPPAVRQATWKPPRQDSSPLPSPTKGKGVSSPLFPGGRGVGEEGVIPPQDASASLTDTLLRILGSWNVCSKEWIIRQYDHEVQGGTMIKPLVGIHEDGPGDAAVIVPVLGSWRGLAVACGINPHYGDLDPYQMAACAIDEAVRNVVAVGADPERIALLDNFCWGNTDRPETLGSLVLAALACHDLALAYNMPFISGKDSLNNEYHFGDRHLVIPPTLLISALGQVPDVRQCVTMDLKEAGNVLYLLGRTVGALGGSHYHLVRPVALAPVAVPANTVPRVDPAAGLPLFRKLHQAIRQGLVRSCHDLSEGGLAVAAAEMAFAGGVGADITGLAALGLGLTEEQLLFAEDPTRFLVEVPASQASSFEGLLGKDVPFARIGQTVKEPRLRIAGRSGGWIIWAGLADLKEAWQQPLRRG